MKVVWEHLKSIILLRLLAIITPLMILGIYPICFYMFNLTVSQKKDDPAPGDIFIFLIIIGFFFSISFFPTITLPKLSLLKLFKLHSLLKHGVYTKAKVIDIQETKKHTTFYLQLMSPEYKNDILKYKISFFEYHKQSSAAKILEENIIIRNRSLSRKFNNDDIVKPDSEDDTIYYFNEYNYLTLNSVVSILYNPDKKNSWMICPFWDVWRRNHWIDDFYNYQDESENKEIHKQRIISKENLFKDELPFHKQTIITALIILAISLLDKGFFLIVAIVECCLFLMRFTWAKFYFSRHHNFYEYSVVTTGTITSATEITERAYKSKRTYWLYKYKFQHKMAFPIKDKCELVPHVT